MNQVKFTIRYREISFLETIIPRAKKFLDSLTFTTVIYKSLLIIVEKANSMYMDVRQMESRVSFLDWLKGRFSKEFLNIILLSTRFLL